MPSMLAYLPVAAVLVVDVAVRLGIAHNALHV